MWRRFRRDPVTEPVAVDPAARERALESAYARGREDGRREERARRSHPIRNLLVGTVAIAGGTVLAVAAWYGSFGRGGEVVDQKLAVAADRAEPVMREAVGDAGVAVREAGRDLQSVTDDRSSDQTL